jgi:hypothetical protein
MKRFGFIALIIAVLAIGVAPASAQQRGGGFSQRLEKTVGELNYHALVIGINQYSSDIPNLKTSVNDARAVKDLLISKFGFPASNVTELFNKKATRANILRAFRELSITLTPNDALVIYYAGHGIEDMATSTGYWIPSDASSNAYESYVSNAVIRTYLRAIKARHIFLVSDSCFSGTLLAQRAMPGEIDERFYARKAASRSRVVLTSGGNEPVMDAGKSGHSVFGYFFLKILRDYEKPYLIPTQIFAEVGPLVANNAPQTPQWGSLRNAMDEGGEIVFVNKHYQAPAFLAFTSNKPSAVYLNGQFIGNTPIASYKVSPGNHSYKIACAEMALEKSGSIAVNAGMNQTISEMFQPQPDGYLTVHTKPWSKVYLDGVFLGETPIYKKKLPVGSYSIRFENSQFGLNSTRVIKVHSAQITTIAGPVN